MSFSRKFLRRARLATEYFSSEYFSAEDISAEFFSAEDLLAKDFSTEDFSAKDFNRCLTLNPSSHSHCGETPPLSTESLHKDGVGGTPQHMNHDLWRGSLRGGSSPQIWVQICGETPGGATGGVLHKSRA